MEERPKALLKAAGLTLLPIALAFPVLAAARFGPCGPSSGWALVLFAPLAIWMQQRALRVSREIWRGGRDLASLAVLPLGLVSIAVSLVSSLLFLLALPAFLFELAELR
jgi:hypothetical protein